MKRKFKAGKYYIGDPCYVVNDVEWDDLLEQTSYFTNEEQSYKGHNIFAGATAYGDGVYYDNEGREYGVDSGNLGIVAFEAIEKKKRGKYLANVVNFKEDFKTEIIDGIFRFGSIIIYTDEETFDKCFDKCFDKFSENQFNEFYDIFYDKFFDEQFDEFHDEFFDKIFNEFSCEFKHNVIYTCFDDYYNKNFDSYFDECFNQNFDEYYKDFINEVQVN